MQFGDQRFVRELLLRRFRNPEINHLRHRLPVQERHQDVGGLQVPVNDPLLVRVLDRVAHGHEQPQPRLGAQLVLVAVLGELDPLDQFHDEIGPARLSDDEANRLLQRPYRAPWVHPKLESV
jgi:hypothetical protein